MNKNIIFFTLPPYRCNTPNPAFSILKSTLENNNISVSVKYLNIELYDENRISKGSFDELEPYVYLLNQLYCDNSKLEEFKLKYFSIYGEKYLTDKSLSNDFWSEFIKNINCVFDNAIDSLDTSTIRFFGFTEKYYQWVPAILLANKLKTRYPEIPIVIGGFGDKDKAKLFLDSFKWFDYATWGEGEDVIIKLYNELIKGKKKKLKTVPRLAFHESEKIVLTNAKTSYLDLNQEILPDYSDFFAIENPIGQDQIRLPIETSRGCHWCRCKFCYLNQGYKYRESSNKKLLQSIEHLTSKYNCYNISFVDNDIIGLSIEKFNDLLDGLIELRRKTNNKLAVKVAEVIPFKKDSSVIKKMALAGFENIQIGYEAVTDSLLAKMNKKQKFASNIFLIKFCKGYNIKVSGANIISDTVGETSSDIIESIHNLHFLRFLFSNDYYQHEVINLCLTKNSIFYKDISEKELSSWSINWLYDNLPESVKSSKERFVLFDFQKEKGNELWRCFKEASEYYYNNQFTYKIFQYGQQVEYREYFNEKEIKSLIFDETYYWEILKLVNNQVLNINEICSILSDINATDISEELLKEQISEMKEEFILYTDKNFETIISIIDTKTILA